MIGLGQAARDRERRIEAVSPARADRLLAIDVVRGVIMALMALDHTRDFFLGFTPDPTDLAETTPALFATRWITHVCAPGFLLLAGVAASLQARRRSPLSLAWYLASRGALLVVLELTIITFVWIPDPSRSLVLLQVIWAIGWSMLLLSLVLFAGPLAVGVLGAALMLGHPLIEPEMLMAIGAPDWLHSVLLGSGEIDRGQGDRLLVSYSILPWTGAMFFGFGLGPLFARPAEIWRPRVMWLGIALVVAFVALRALTSLGDPAPWTLASDPTTSVMAFLNVEKYPPSPLYLAVTLGVVLLSLGGLARIGAAPWAMAFANLGRAPLFFYILHLYVLRIGGLLAAVLVWGTDSLGPPPLKSTPEWPLWSVWAIWLLAMAALYPPTRWFAHLKKRSRARWLRYF